MVRFTYEQIYDRVSALTELATFSNSLAEITRITRDPNGEVKHLAAILGKDPALVMKILRTVNSAFYGFDRSIENVEEATSLLGFSEIERLCIAISVINQLGARSKRGQALRQLWRHSLVCGVAAEALVATFNLRQLDAGDVYMAALLHDIGKAVIWQYFSDVANEIIRLVSTGGRTSHEVEMEVFGGATHCEIGAWVAGNWGLPLGIIESIQQHHSPGLTQDSSALLKVIKVADAVCYQSGVPALTTSAIAPASVEACQFLAGNDAFFTRFRQCWEAKKAAIESMVA